MTKEGNNTNVIVDDGNSKLVLIQEIYFKSRRSICWNTVEQLLKRYVGWCYTIIETSDVVYIGVDFPDEFSHSIDTKQSKGANEKAKANIAVVIGELLKIATNRVEYPDYGEKHGKKAQYGWYRYDTRFGIPVYDADGNLERYNIYTARILVRRDQNKKLYLYDIVRIKKEASRPF